MIRRDIYIDTHRPVEQPHGSVTTGKPADGVVGREAKRQCSRFVNRRNAAIGGRRASDVTRRRQPRTAGGKAAKSVLATPKTVRSGGFSHGGMNRVSGCRRNTQASILVGRRCNFPYRARIAQCRRHTSIRRLFCAMITRFDPSQHSQTCQNNGWPESGTLDAFQNNLA